MNLRIAAFFNFMLCAFAFNSLALGAPELPLSDSREEREIETIRNHFRHQGQRNAPPARFHLFGEPQLKPLPKPEPEFDAIAYTLHFDFPAASLLQPQFEARADLKFNPGKEGFRLLRLDSVGLVIKKVTLLNQFQELQFTQRDEILEIDLAGNYSPRDTLTISIEYSWAKKPNQGVFFRARRTGKPTEAIFSQSEPDDSRQWFPGNSWPNDRATIETYIRVPKPLEAVSNGALLGVEDLVDTRIFHWKMAMPMASYLYVVTAGRFGIDEKNWQVPSTSRTIPLTGYGPADDMERVRHTLRGTADILSFFSEVTGTPYPYEKYAQVFVPQYMAGGMEHTTATTLTDRTLHSESENDYYEGDSLVGHEAAHQWFGDLITAKSWDHLWLNEGFATYFDGLQQEHRVGKDALLSELADSARWYFSDAKQGDQPVVFPYFEEDLGDFFDSHAYAKGAWVLHMLRDRLGDEIFFKGVAAWLKAFRGKVAETADFRRVMEKVSGEDLGRFFDQWLYRPGFPIFDVSWSYHAADTVPHSANSAPTGEIQLVVEQKQDTSLPGDLAGKTPLFQGPIRIEVGGVFQRIILSGIQKEIFRIPSGTLPPYLKFNTAGAWLATVQTRQSSAAWFAQLKLSTDPIARSEAGEAIASDPDIQAAMSALVTCIEQDPSALVRRTCARGVEATAQAAQNTQDQQSLQRGISTISTLLTSGKSVPLSLKQAAAGALFPFGAAQALPVIQMAIEVEKSPWALAAMAGALGKFAPSPRAHDLLLELTLHDSYEDVLRQSGLTALNGFKSLTALPLAERYSKSDPWGDTEWGQKTRAAAFKLLASIGAAHPGDSSHRALKAIEAALGDQAARTRRAAAEALGDLKNPEAIAKLREIAKNDEDPTVREAAKAALAKIPVPEKLHES